MYVSCTRAACRRYPAGIVLLRAGRGALLLLLLVLLQIIGRPQLSAPYSYWPPDGLGQRALVRV